jgi:hypothetical protein
MMIVLRRKSATKPGQERDALQDSSGSGGLGRLSEAPNRLLQGVLRMSEYRSLL